MYATVVFKTLDIRQKRRWPLRKGELMRWSLQLPPTISRPQHRESNQGGLRVFLRWRWSWGFKEAQAAGVFRASPREERDALKQRTLGPAWVIPQVIAKSALTCEGTKCSRPGSHRERILHYHQPVWKPSNSQDPECRVSVVGKQLLAVVSLNKARPERNKNISIIYLSISLSI